MKQNSNMYIHFKIKLGSRGFEHATKVEIWAKVTPVGCSDN